MVCPWVILAPKSKMVMSTMPKSSPQTSWWRHDGLRLDFSGKTNVHVGQTSLRIETAIIFLSFKLPDSIDKNINFTSQITLTYIQLDGHKIEL